MNLRGQYYPGKGVHSTHWTFDWGAPINGLNALKNRKKPPFLSHTGHSLATISTELSWLPLCLFIYLILLRIIQINLLTNQWTKQPTNQPWSLVFLEGQLLLYFPSLMEPTGLLPCSEENLPLDHILNQKVYYCKYSFIKPNKYTYDKLPLHVLVHLCHP
jgi:hypothetical protein